MATEKELKELQKKINSTFANKSSTKEDWFALWDEAERCRKTSDNKIWTKFYWMSGLEAVYMVIAGYKYEEEQQEKEMKL